MRRLLRDRPDTCDSDRHRQRRVRQSQRSGRQLGNANETKEYKPIETASINTHGQTNSLTRRLIPPTLRVEKD